MTREEAIYCMKSYMPDDSYKHCVRCKYYKEDSCESSKAHTMAIKALEEQKTGIWMDVPLDRYVLLHRCSNCSHCSDTASNYCPNCGAKMEAEK